MALALQARHSTAWATQVPVSHPKPSNIKPPTPNPNPQTPDPKFQTPDPKRQPPTPNSKLRTVRFTQAHTRLISQYASSQVPLDVFHNYVLPYASLTERREEWRGLLSSKLASLVVGATTSLEAGAAINKGVRALPSQSQGLANTTHPVTVNSRTRVPSRTHVSWTWGVFSLCRRHRGLPRSCRICEAPPLLLYCA